MTVSTNATKISVVIFLGTNGLVRKTFPHFSGGGLNAPWKKRKPFYLVWPEPRTFWFTVQYFNHVLGHQQLHFFQLHKNKSNVVLGPATKNFKFNVDLPNPSRPTFMEVLV